MKVRWVMRGLDGQGNPWVTQGTVYCQGPNFDAAVSQVQRESFEQLTQGKATYGQPGKGGCRGPYTITELHAEKADDSQVN